MDWQLMREERGGEVRGRGRVCQIQSLVPGSSLPCLLGGTGKRHEPGIEPRTSMNLVTSPNIA